MSGQQQPAGLNQPAIAYNAENRRQRRPNSPKIVTTEASYGKQRKGSEKGVVDEKTETQQT